MKKNISKLLKITLISLVLSFAVGYVFVSAWNGPSSPPPGGNRPTPINVSATPQAKGGIALPGSLLNINGIFSAQSIITSGLNITELQGIGDRPACFDNNGTIKICGSSTYTLGLSRAPVAGGNVTGSGSYQAGAVANLSATPNTGYSFLRWSDSAGGTASTSSTFAYTMPASNTTLTANFSLISSYTLTLNRNPIAGGNVTGSGSYQAGATANISATPNTGYTFTRWANSSGVTVSTSSTFAYTMPAGNTTLTAHFTPTTQNYPDLTASVPTPSSTLPGSVTFSGTIYNNGNASTGTGTFTNLFQRSSSPSGSNPTNTAIPGMASIAAGGSRPIVTPSINLAAGTYYVRFCADLNASFVGTINEGTTGNENNNCSAWTPVTISTAIVAPAVTTTPATFITSNAATSGGNITSSGGANVTARGVAYGTSANPTISGSHTTNGTGAGSFTSPISGLTPSTLYNVRAYATNNAGLTGYGSNLTFTTTATPPSTYTLTLSKSGTGSGAVTSVPSGISCGTSCSTDSANYPASTSVTLNVVPTPGSVVSGGGGCDSFAAGPGYATCTVVMSSAKAINFIINSGNAFPDLTAINLSPVTANPGNITFTASISNITPVPTPTGVTFTNLFEISTNPNGTNPTRHEIPGMNPLAGNGGQDNASKTISLTAGTYYNRFCADNNSSFVGVINEGSMEGNNCSSWRQIVVGSPNALPTVTTIPATSIATYSATLGGNVTSAGSTAVTERGIAYGTSINPTTSGDHIVVGSGTGVFTQNVGLSANTLYHFRAYAKNTAGTSYGSNLTFTTLPVPPPNTYTLILNSTPVAGGTTGPGGTYQAGATVNISATPSTGYTFTRWANSSGVTVSTNSTYAYTMPASNATLTAHFTQNTTVSVATNQVTNITSNSATVSATTTGIATVAGIVWSDTLTYPTITNNSGITYNGWATGSWTSQMTGLTDSKLYYVRAYATNSAGVTVYGANLNLTTLGVCNSSGDFTTAVSGTFNRSQISDPDCVLTVRLWGAGGGGGGGGGAKILYNSVGGGGGGGPGGYTEKTYTYSQLNNYNEFTVGVGGAGGAGGPPGATPGNPGTNGGDTQFIGKNSTVTAYGGGGGGGATITVSPYGNPGIGGLAGLGNGDLVIYGTSGGSQNQCSGIGRNGGQIETLNTGFGLGGVNGGGPNCEGSGMGGQGGNSPGAPTFFSGGGGGGGGGRGSLLSNYSGGQGGNGANGKIQFSW